MKSLTREGTRTRVVISVSKVLFLICLPFSFVVDELRRPVFSQDDRVKMRISVILVKTKPEAQKILQKLRAGADFAELARQYSFGPGKEKGGDLGYFAPEEMMEQLNPIVVNLKIGEFSEIVETSEGYFILMKTDEKYAFEVMTAQAQEKLWNELYDRVISLHQEGLYSEATKVAEKALTVATRSYGPNHTNVALSLSNLAVLYQSQGKYAKAEPLFKRSLKILEKALGEEHPRVALYLNNLAGFYSSQGKYAKAEPLYRRSLKIWEKVLGEEHPRVALYLNNLAVLYQDQGKCSKAEPLYRRSLKILEKALGKDHPMVATTLENMEKCSREVGKKVEAEKLAEVKIEMDNEEAGSHGKSLSYPYSLQVGSFHTLERAKRAIALYSKNDLSPYWVKVDLKEKGVWYRVFTGHFEDLEQVERFRQEHGLTKSIVRKTKYANLIGIYTSSDELEAKILSLKNLGYSPYVIEGPESKSRLFVGGFLNQAEAEEQYNDLKSHNVPSQVVKR